MSDFVPNFGQLSLRPAEPEYRYLVALDYGTTMSAAAYVRIPKERALDAEELSTILGKIHSIDRYPKANSSKQMIEEVPSVQRYKDHCMSSWGYPSINPRKDDESARLEFAKLLLHDAPNTLSIRSEAQTQLRAVRRQDEDVIADFLRSWYRHVEDRISQRDKQRPLIECVLCVPAIWSLAAKAQMKSAAQKAGVPLSKDPCLISEPQAAASYVLESDSRFEADDGDILIIVDGGGGTVDVIPLLVRQRRPLILEEVAEGDGESCGSIFIDRNCEDLLRRRLKNVDSLTNKEQLIKKVVREFATDFKPYFENDQEDEATFDVSGLEASIKQGFLDGLLRISRQEIVNMFDPVVDQIIVLIKRVIHRFHEKMRQSDKALPQIRVRDILFVGGLSGSRYVEKRLTDAFYTREEVGYPIGVRALGARPSAIACGAILRALNKSIVTKTWVRQSIGISQDVKWDKKLHANWRKNYDKFWRCQIVCGVVYWLIKRADVISTWPGAVHEAKSGVLLRSLPFNATYDDYEFVEYLYVSDSIDKNGLKIDRNPGIKKRYDLKFNLFHAVSARREIAFGEWDKEAIHGAAGSETLSHDAGPVERRGDTDETDTGDDGQEEGPEGVELPERRTQGTYWSIRYELVLKIIDTDVVFEVVAPPGGDVYAIGKPVLAEAFTRDDRNAFAPDIS